MLPGEIVIPLKAYGARPILLHDDVVNIGHVVLNHSISKGLILRNDGSLPGGFRYVCPYVLMWLLNTHGPGAF